MARPKKQRLSAVEAQNVRDLVREGKLLALLSHEDLDQAIGAKGRWTANTLNRTSGIDPADAYKILHAVLRAVPLSDARPSQTWRAKARVAYDRLRPVLIPVPIATPAMYVPENAISEFGQALSEFLANRPIPILLSASACESFLSRSVQPRWEAKSSLDFRHVCRKQLQTTIEWALDSSEKIGQISRADLVGCIEDIDRAFERTRKRRAPKLRRVNWVARKQASRRRKENI